MLIRRGGRFFALNDLPIERLSPGTTTTRRTSRYQTGSAAALLHNGPVTCHSCRRPQFLWVSLQPRRRSTPIEATSSFFENEWGEQKKCLLLASRTAE
jgi:hypothetical protein